MKSFGINLLCLAAGYLAARGWIWYSARKTASATSPAQSSAPAPGEKGKDKGG